MQAARESFQVYYRWLDINQSGKLNDQGCDIDRRLQQAYMILKRVSQLLSDQRSLDALTVPDEDIEHSVGREAMLSEWRERNSSEAVREAYREQIDHPDWLELLTEQFYWIAFRARSGIKRLPHLHGFEAVGVRNARNKLIEHNDRDDSQVFNGGFAWGMAQGPTLAAARMDQQPQHWKDEGLFVNAINFASGLQAAIARTPAGNR
jgi:hypothetical protein